MRVLGTVLTGLLVVALLGLGVPPADAGSGCRAQWSDLRSLHAENGNPGGSAAVLVDRWETFFAQAGEYAETATPDDCGDTLQTFERKWNGLELLMYGLTEFDLPFWLSVHERDRKHWLELRRQEGLPAVLPDWLQGAFHRLRRQAPRSYAVLAPVLAGAGDVPVGKQRRVSAYLDQVSALANGDRHYVLGQRADELIWGAELDEE